MTDRTATKTKFICFDDPCHQATQWRFGQVLKDMPRGCVTVAYIGTLRDWTLQGLPLTLSVNAPGDTQVPGWVLRRDSLQTICRSHREAQWVSLRASVAVGILGIFGESLRRLLWWWAPQKLSTTRRDSLWAFLWVGTCGPPKGIRRHGIS